MYVYMHPCALTGVASPVLCCNVHLRGDYISVCIMNAVYKGFCCLAITEVYLESMAGIREMIPMGTSRKCSVSRVMIV